MTLHENTYKFPVIFQQCTAIHTAASLNSLDALEILLLHPASKHLVDRSEQAENLPHTIFCV